MPFTPNVNIELKRYEELLKKESQLKSLKQEILECCDVDDHDFMNVIVELDKENVKAFFYKTLGGRHKDYLREVKIV